MLEDGWDNTHSRIRISREVARTLWRMRREPQSAVTAELRRSDPGLQDLVGNFALNTEQVELTSLDVPFVVKGWHKESDNGRLVLTQQHLLRSLRGRENALVIP